MSSQHSLNRANFMKIQFQVLGCRAGVYIKYHDYLVTFLHGKMLRQLTCIKSQNAPFLT